MALIKRPPNTILLGGGLPGGDGGHTIDNEHSGGVQITPGMLIELYNAGGGKTKYRPNASATEVAAPIVALEKLIHNKTVDDVYAVNELILAAHLRSGSTWWALVPSGETITGGDLAQSAGNGMLKKATDTTAGAALAKFQFLETLGTVTATTRCRAMVL